MDAAVLDERLCRAFGFTADDLAANRANTLTDTQQAWFEAKRRGYLRSSALTLGGMWLLFIMLIVASLLAPGTSERDRAMLPYALLALTSFFLFCALASLIHARSLIRGRISVAQGKANPRVVRVRLTNSYQLRLGGRTFHLLSAAQLDIFQAGAAYRIYFISYPPLHLILSAEMLAEPP